MANKPAPTPEMMAQWIKDILFDVSKGRHDFDRQHATDVLAALKAGTIVIATPHA